MEQFFSKDFEMKSIKEIFQTGIQKLYSSIWKQQNDEGKIVSVVVFLIFLGISIFLVMHSMDMTELRKNHLYCYGIVVDISRTEIYHYRVSYTVGENSFSRSWQRKKGTANLGDTVLVMYNPKKPSVHTVIEYDGRFVTKRMVDFRAYPIDKTLIQYGPGGQIILKQHTPSD